MKGSQREVILVLGSDEQHILKNSGGGVCNLFNILKFENTAV